MRFLQTLFNSIVIICLLIIIGVLLSLFIPAMGKSLHDYEYKDRNNKLERKLQ